MDQDTQAQREGSDFRHGTQDFLSDRTLRWLRYGLIVLSCVMILLFLDSAFLRIRYAYEYDWIEDGNLACVRHILQGKPLYSAPSVLFTPYLYTPLFFYTVAAVSKLLSVSYFAARLVSVVSTLGCFAGIYRLVFTETRQRVASLFAVACFASAYPIAGEWFDLGRVDMLYLMFVTWAVYATRRWHPAVAAVLWVCAFQTKQGVLPIALVLLCHDWQRPRRVLVGAGTFFVALGGSIAWLTYATHGWYRYYVFGLAGSLGIEKHRLRHYVPTDLMEPYGIALLIVLCAFLVTPARLRQRTAAFYLLGTAAFLAFTGYIRSHNGASANSVLPAYLWISIIAGVSLARLRSSFTTDSSSRARLALGLLLTGACVQLITHLYTPHEFVPRSDQVQWRQGFEEQIRSIPGDVLLINYPEFARAAGKTSYASGEATGAVLDAKDRAQALKLQADYAEWIHERKFNALVLDRSMTAYLAYEHIWMPRDILRYYPLRVAAIGGSEVDFPLEPRWIYLPCSQASVAVQLDPLLDTARACSTDPPVVKDAVR